MKKPAMKKAAAKRGTPAKMPKGPKSPAKTAPMPKGPKFAGRNKGVSALDKAIMEGKKLPSKNKKPGRYLDK